MYLVSITFSFQDSISRLSRRAWRISLRVTVCWSIWSLAQAWTWLWKPTTRTWRYRIPRHWSRITRTAQRRHAWSAALGRRKRCSTSRRNLDPSTSWVISVWCRPPCRRPPRPPSHRPRRRWWPRRQQRRRRRWNRRRVIHRHTDTGQTHRTTTKTWSYRQRRIYRRVYRVTVRCHSRTRDYRTTAPHPSRFNRTF